eukprot:scaffold583_cov176-Amphora_coffeaeformis.AAC.1
MHSSPRRGGATRYAPEEKQARRGIGRPYTTYDTTTMASATASSPLFDQPFAPMNFSNGGSNDGRLRRRENDSLQTPASRASTPLYTQQPPGYYSHAPRRRGKTGADAWVPRLFKAVLWSPVVVVAIWCTSAVLFTRTTRGSNTAGVLVRPSAQKAPKQQNKKHRKESSRAEYLNEGMLNVAEVLETALGKEQPQQHHGLLPIVAPLGNTGKNNEKQPGRLVNAGHRVANFVHGLGDMVQGRPSQGKVIVQPANLQHPPPMGSYGAGVYEPDGGVYRQPAMGSYGAGVYEPDGGVYRQPAMGSYGAGVYEPDGGVYRQPAMGSYGAGVYEPDGGVYRQPAMGSYGAGVYEPDGGVYRQPNMGSYGAGVYEPDGGVYKQPSMGADGGVYQPDGGVYRQPNMGSYGAGVYEPDGGVYKQPSMQADGGVYQPDGGVYRQPSMGADGGVYQPNGGVYKQPNMGSYGAGVYQPDGGVYRQPSMQADGAVPDGGVVQQPAMGLSGGGKSNHLRGSTQYLYYNPRDVVVVDGQVYLPSQAYDKNGKAHDLTKSHAQVYIQPPPLYGVHHFNHSNVTDSNYTYTRP